MLPTRYASLLVPRSPPSLDTGVTREDTSANAGCRGRIGGSANTNRQLNTHSEN